MESTTKRKYLSDTDKNYKKLEEYLESGEFGDLPDQASNKLQHDSNSITLVIEDVLKRNPALANTSPATELSNINKSLADLLLPTRYDSPTSYHLIRDLINQLKESAKDLEINTEDFPFYATVPTGKVNAMAVNLPDSSKPFLLFDGQLLTFCHLISKIYATCLSPDDNSYSISIETVKSKIRRQPEIADRLSGVLDAFIKTGRPGTSKPFPVDMRSAKLAHAFCKGMELFVVAHEFGHVYAGHLSELLSKLHIISPFQTTSINHKKEHEADLIALILTVHSLKKEGIDLAISVAGINLFFSVLDLADQYGDFISYGRRRKFSSKESETHPSNENRKKLIEDAIENIGVPHEELNTSKVFKKITDETTSFLWEAITSKNKNPGRNDPCPCGSGKKHKKCCLS